MDITQQLFALADEKYRDFSSKLMPGIAKETVIGVRVPMVRKLAKDINGTKEAGLFLQTLPHRYFDENMLHGQLLSEIKDFATCLAAVEAFLPFVDNWAVCDVMSPKVFKKHKAGLLPEIKKWLLSSHTYTCRFAMGMLMGHFLDGDFKAEYLEWVAGVRSDEYYVNMMVAWFFATALAKQWVATIPYIEQNRLPVWVHNKTIQKAVESYRITSEQKIYLKSLKKK